LTHWKKSSVPNLINRVPEIAENDQLRAEFLSAFGALARLCTR
jgi:hypothetical protein